MKDNEDEPEDVRAATPVAEEIKKGEINEYSKRPIEPQQSPTKRRHRCEKDHSKSKVKEKSEGECCRAKEAKFSAAPQTATAFVYEKKCTFPKIKPIPRHCLKKQEWIDILATPRRKCPSACLQKPVTRRLRPVSARMSELAQPPKHRLINTLQSRADILPIEFVDKLIQNLERGTCLTPEQAENIFREKEHRSRKKSPKGKKKTTKCPDTKFKDSGGAGSILAFDKDATNCQYAMAESFVRSILDWKCPIPRNEFKDITEVVLGRLRFLFENEPVNGGDRKSQQMRFLAEFVGSWISGILFEVAETRKTELEEECERRLAEAEEESEETSDDDFWGKDDKPEDDEDDFRKRDDKPHARDDDTKPDDDDDDKKKDDDTKKDDDKIKDDDKKKENDEEKEGDLEEGEKFHDAKTETSQEIDEKKTPITEPEQEESTQDQPTEDETQKTEKIDQADKEEEEKMPSDRSLDEHDSDKSEPQEAEKTLQTEIDAGDAKESSDVEPVIKETDGEMEKDEDKAATLHEVKEVTFDPSTDEGGQEVEIMDVEKEEPRKIDADEEDAVKRKPEEETKTIQPEEIVEIDTKDKSDAEEKISKEKVAEIEKEQIKVTEKKSPMDQTDQMLKTIGESEMKKVEGLYPSVTKYRDDTPFVTFDKIFHTIYNAIERNKENDGDDPVTNRLHRAVFEKLSNIVQEDQPTDQLSDLTKDVLDVISGKIAIWMKSSLSESQTRLINQSPASVESNEVREWSRWIDLVLDTAQDWSKWIQNTVREAEDIGSQRRIKKGRWANWTESVDSDALRWRRFYLASLHQAHQNLTVLRDRPVVKTGTKISHDLREDKYGNEREVKITELEVDADKNQ